MDIPTIEYAATAKPSPQPEAPSPSPHAGWHKNPHYLIAGGIFLSVYIAFNIWLYNRVGDMTLEKFPVINQLIKNPWTRDNFGGKPKPKDASAVPSNDDIAPPPDGQGSNPARTSSASKQRTTQPSGGSMPFACDPQGICNIYDKPKEKGCPQTFSDSNCSNKCADKAVRCKK